MRLRELQAHLEDCRCFDAPKVQLEQYPTSAHIAARLLYMAQSMHGDIEGRTCLDLGCGTGMLALGCALLGAQHVVGVDIDEDALETAAANLEPFDQESLPVELLCADVAALPLRQHLGGGPADTVVMNPPFGTRRKGADIEFLHAALQLARRAVYSLHKTSTRAHVKRWALGPGGARCAEVLAELRFDLPASYAFHRAKTKDVAVDLWRFVPRRESAGAQL